MIGATMRSQCNYVRAENGKWVVDKEGDWQEVDMSKSPYVPYEGNALDKQEGGSHYKDMPIQPVEFIHRNGLGFLEGCVIKRVCRWHSKDGVQDLRKAIHELELLIEFAEKNA